MTLADPGELLQKLHLTIGQLAEMTGLSIRQISYWTGKGIIEASNPKRRLYDYQAVEKALAIKRGLDDGLSLNDATLEAEEHISDKREYRDRWPERYGASASGYLMSRLSDLEKLANETRRQIQLLERQGQDRQKRIAMAKLEVVDLLAQNPFTRDTASRIADRLGRAIDLVQIALDELASENAIETIKYGDRVICQLPAPKPSRGAMVSSDPRRSAKRVEFRTSEEPAGRGRNDRGRRP